MTKQEFLKAITPASGFSDLLGVYINWSGVGFVCAIIAERLDHFSGISYASYYTTSLNSAIGVKFWALISIVGLLLFCLSLPLIYLAEKLPGIQSSCQRFRFFSYGFFLVAFDEGALILGILAANLVHANEKAELLTDKSFLFTEASLLSIVLLIVANSLLWLLGESLYNRQHKNYSGIVRLIISCPLKYSIPLYMLFTIGFVMFVINQS
ncbi:MxaP protein [methane-oxidizing endosymbiont of Gigantopelta aegis]|uniref:MxaP protein n=1 Tax=methane-oxidizing endosymbiont of Gigantopelta aegis TaxID=2794938 RepID=UPI0018DCB442|nr:MxaP protein [methane-oxidizing endosymbiont of Gigantopelta aegis]